MTSLEQHLARHRHSLGVGQCACGKRDDDTLTTIAGVQAAHDAHVAAAWREARTVRTVEDLDALPIESVIRDSHGFVLQNDESSRPCIPSWWGPGDDMSSRPALPATILWTPEDGAL